jgi:hypothetical protein
VIASALYALLRVISAVRAPVWNPATIVGIAQGGYFWRIWTVLYASGMVALLGYLAARRDPTNVARALARALPWAVLALVGQAALVP